ARSDAWFIYHLGRRLKEKAKGDTRARNAGLNALTWDYPVEGKEQEPKIEVVLKEINGWTVADRKQISHMQELKNDGSTACGAWIYCGVYPEEGRNRADERNPRDLLGHGWGFAWPNDCRIIYNRASADPDGKPWSERKKLIWWDAEKKEWTGLDNADYKKDLAPDTPDD
ncbi:MAG: formate dehydrogenase, partial [Acidobacteria bacterium]